MKREMHPVFEPTHLREHIARRPLGRGFEDFTDKRSEPTFRCERARLPEKLRRARFVANETGECIKVDRVGVETGGVGMCQARLLSSGVFEGFGRLIKEGEREWCGPH